MKLSTSQPGVTIVELLVVMAIIAILAVGMFTVGEYVNTQAKEKLAQSTIETLVTALEEFHEYGYKYRPDSISDIDIAEKNFYRGLDFPLDCNEFPKSDLEDELEIFVGASNPPKIDGQFDNDNTYAGSSALYFCLSRVPSSRKVLNSIDTSLLSNKDINNSDLNITIGPRTYPLIRIVDPWGTPLHYDYYDEWETKLDEREKSKKTFPVITSAGPDKKLGTDDDITSR